MKFLKATDLEADPSLLSEYYKQQKFKTDFILKSLQNASLSCATIAAHLGATPQSIQGLFLKLIRLDQITAQKVKLDIMRHGYAKYTRYLTLYSLNPNRTTKTSSFEDLVALAEKTSFDLKIMYTAYFGIRMRAIPEAALALKRDELDITEFEVVNYISNSNWMNPDSSTNIARKLGLSLVKFQEAIESLKRKGWVKAKYQRTQYDERYCSSWMEITYDFAPNLILRLYDKSPHGFKGWIKYVQIKLPS